nr:sigma-70 family RNA polymerase sigma factor [Clostridium butyricum]
MKFLSKINSQKRFSENLEKSRDKLYRFAYCYVKNEDDALDILSEAVYKGYISFHKLRDEKYFETWMIRIIINCANDFFKKTNKYVYLDEHNIENIKDINTSLSMEDRMDLYDLMDRLPDDEKTIIILKYFQELNFREISEVLSLPENTVKSKLYRTIKKLNKYLKEDEVKFND